MRQAATPRLRQAEPPWICGLSGVMEQAECKQVSGQAWSDA